MEATAVREPQRHPSNRLLAQIFNTIHENLHEHLSYEHVLDSLFTSLEGVIPFDRLGIALLVDQGQNLRLKWVNSKIPTNWLTESYTIPIKESGLGEILKDGKTRIINDLKAYYDENPGSGAIRLILKDGFRSNLTCPLVIDKTPIGIMFFSSMRPNTYAKEHEDICWEISEGIAALIHRSDEKRNVYRRMLHDLEGPLQIMHRTLEQIENNRLYQGLDKESEKAFYNLKNNCSSMTSTIQSLLGDKPSSKLS